MRAEHEKTSRLGPWAGPGAGGFRLEADWVFGNSPHAGCRWCGGRCRASMESPALRDTVCQFIKAEVAALDVLDQDALRAKRLPVVEAPNGRTSSVSAMSRTS